MIEDATYILNYCSIKFSVKNTFLYLAGQEERMWIIHEGYGCGELYSNLEYALNLVQWYSYTGPKYA